MNADFCCGIFSEIVSSGFVSKTALTIRSSAGASAFLWWNSGNFDFMIVDLLSVSRSTRKWSCCSKVCLIPSGTKLENFDVNNSLCKSLSFDSSFRTSSIKEVVSCPYLFLWIGVLGYRNSIDPGCFSTFQEARQKCMIIDQ